MVGLFLLICSSRSCLVPASFLRMAASTTEASAWTDAGDVIASAYEL